MINSKLRLSKLLDLFSVLQASSVSGCKWPECQTYLMLNSIYIFSRVSSSQGKVREIPDLAKVRENSGNFVEGQGENEYWQKSGKSQGICM